MTLVLSSTSELSCSRSTSHSLSGCRTQEGSIRGHQLRLDAVNETHTSKL
jgi:hypothetical protein